MPLYFFDITDGRRAAATTARDRAGVELADEAAARAHGLMVLGGFVMPSAASPIGETQVACRDEAGAVLFVVSFRERPAL